MVLTRVGQQGSTSNDGFPEAAGYPRSGRPRIVVVPERRCIAIDGEGEPGGAAFEEAMAEIYRTAYGLHFRLRDRGVNTHVPPVECLWVRRNGAQEWAEGPVAFDPSAWRWTLLMTTPEDASEADVEVAIGATGARRPKGAPGRPERRTIAEGLVVEAMHIGPYAAEPETIATMHRMAASAGLRPRGAHHEIYLGDPRRAKPENLRTVLRQPLH
jgi:hypothetical protein